MTKNKKLIINACIPDTRIALVEDGRLLELYMERSSNKAIVGNIYKATVTRVLPGMQCAFVNIGSAKSAFLYGGDVLDRNNIPTSRSDSEDDIEFTNRKPIETLIQSGQQITVQVAKEPLGSKGPRVTMVLTLPGQFLVLMPDINNIAVSRRIEDEEVRNRLTKEVEAIKPSSMGVIIRTAAATASPQQLKKDLDFLVKIWESVAEKQHKSSAPTQLYQEPNIILKTARDLYSEDVDEFIVDEKQAYEQLNHFLKDSIPKADFKLTLHDSRNPIFDEYDIEMDVLLALAKKVWLPSGGYIVVEQTEALVSFDVNTGKFVGASDVRETILKTNLEAAQEIANQLRLRNIGGIIIIDFIDMEHEEDRQKVNQKFEQSLKNDKARTNVLSINELGLVQMTRKRISDSLERILTENCAYCNGTSRVNKVETDAYNLTRELDRYLLQTNKRSVEVKIRQDVLDWILTEEPQLLSYLKEKYSVEIAFRRSPLDKELLSEPSYEILT
ncbi:MAG: Rne/Rng family ribonuclease [Oligoflexales bacterium]